MEDSKIIDLFFARSEDGILELGKKYGDVCMKLSNNILNNEQDAQECVNDAYFALWQKIPPEKPNPLISFLCKIVRNISITRYRYNTAERRNSIYDVALSEIEGCLAASESVEKELENRDLTRMIENFLDTLTKENRILFLKRYWFSMPVAEISKQMGMSEHTVCVRLYRLRNKLRTCLNKEGVFL